MVPQMYNFLKQFSKLNYTMMSLFLSKATVSLKVKMVPKSKSTNCKTANNWVAIGTIFSTFEIIGGKVGNIYLAFSQVLDQALPSTSSVSPKSSYCEHIEIQVNTHLTENHTKT